MIDRIVLFPYYLTLKIRNALYNSGRKPSAKASVPTICVGGITVGGTGKTPFTEMILRVLQNSPEWKERNVAVLSRGYKRNSTGFQIVKQNGTTRKYGDEPMQIKRKFPSTTVAVCRNRVEGCDYLTHPDKSVVCSEEGIKPADMIILDDAYQARELRASLNIVLVDYNRPIFKDMLLPMGMLRDIPERLFDADIVVVTKCPSDLHDSEREDFAKGLKYKDYDFPASSMVTAPNGRRQLLLFATVDYLPFVPLTDKTETRFVYSKSIVLFTGIAQDAPLFYYLTDKYRVVERLIFPDHHQYVWADFDKIIRALQENPTAGAVTTEKDAQRLMDFHKLEEPLPSRVFYAPISMRFLDPTEEQLFAERITGLV